MPPRKRLGQLLTELGVIDDHQLQSALGHQRQWGGKLGGILVQKGFCAEEQLVSALAQHLNMERVKLAEAKIDPRAVKLVSKQIAEKLHVFPYQVTGAGRSEVISIAMSDPTDLSAVDQLAFHTGKRIKPLLAAESEVSSAIQSHYGAAEEKKEPTDKVARPPGAAQAPAPGFPKRIEPQHPAAPAPRPPPFAPPPPAAAAHPAAKPEESAAQPAKAPPPAEPVDLPEDDGGDLGLEPIAAHSQFGDTVSGSEEVAGEGSAGDAMEGLVSAGVMHEGVEEARAATFSQGPESAAESPSDGWGEPAPGAGSSGSVPAEGSAGEWGEAQPADAGWGAAEPASAAAASWSGAEPGQGWSMEAPATSAGWSAPAKDQAWDSTAAPAEEEPPSEALPTDAILGALELTPGEEGSAEEGWGAEPDVAAAEAQPEAGMAAGPELRAAEPEPAALDQGFEAAAEGAPAEGSGAPGSETEEFPQPVIEARADREPSEPGLEAPDLREDYFGAPGDLSLDAPAGLKPEPVPEPDLEAPPELSLEPSPELNLGEPSGLDTEGSAEMGIEALAERALEASAEPRDPLSAVESEAAMPARDGDTEPIPPPSFALPSEEHEAEPPDAWAASDDPLAAEAAPDTSLSAGGLGEDASGAPDHATDEFANPVLSAEAGEEPSGAAAEVASESAAVQADTSAFEAAGESAEAAPGEPAAPQENPPGESTERFAGQEDVGEGWTPSAVPPPPEAPWIGAALEGSTPLSPADLGTLASIGIGPGDNVGALRLLAALVRMLNRSQLIEPEELRAEIRESCAAGAAAAAQPPNGVEPEDSPGEAAPSSSTPAET
jgi:hypothetical protein